MQMYQDLNDYEKAAVRRRGMLLLGLLSVFVFVLIVSYGVQVWRDVSGVIGGSKQLEVTISGEGKVTAKPDVAKITISVLTEKASLREAQEDNSRRSNAVVEYLKKRGIESKDIKTVSYHINPQYSYPRPCPPYLRGVANPCPLEDQLSKIVGYQLRNAFEVTIRDIGKAGDILGGVVGTGANEVSGINFTIDDPEALKAEARTKAIENARMKAKALAKDLNRRLGKIVSFSESGGYFPPIYLRESEISDKGGAIPAPAPAIEPGENEITVNVTVQFEFK